MSRQTEPPEEQLSPRGLVLGWREAVWMSLPIMVLSGGLLGLVFGFAVILTCAAAVPDRIGPALRYGLQGVIAVGVALLWLLLTGLAEIVFQGGVRAFGGGA